VTALKHRAAELFRSVQNSMCLRLEKVDGGTTFRTDEWERPGGGGGITRVLENGSVFEKAGVNFSEVFGRMPDSLASTIQSQAAGFFATGVSLVLHPRNPMVPAVHANLRYFETEDGDAWFAGGTDLTPYYLFPEDVVHFHGTLRGACDGIDTGYYPRFKKWCDEYFFVKHRGEARGVGGIFFDYLKDDLEKQFRFVTAVADAFPDAYLPLVDKRTGSVYGDRERAWQCIRRGRYVEFNLVYDRGTAFGLETEGRTESILMSLPPLVEWRYDFRPESGSKEEELLIQLRNPREWVEG